LVAGAPSLLLARWPELKTQPEKLALILFSTARDLGAPGVDTVYGWGLLDVGNAFSAQGNVSVVRPSGSTITVSGTSLTGSPTFSRLASALGELTVYDKFDRDFALRETGALQVRRSLYPQSQGLARLLLGQGSQQDWSSSFFVPSKRPSAFMMYGSSSEIAPNPVTSDRDARFGLDVPFAGGIAQLRLTGASATRADFANDPSLKPLSFFASSALLNSSVLAHTLVRVSGGSSVSFYAARTTAPIRQQVEQSLTPQLWAERQSRQLSFGEHEPEQEKSTIGFGYWARPDSRTVIGLNGSVIAQKGGWYDLGFDVPGETTSTRIVNVGALASRRFGAWEASLSGELSHLKTSGDGIFRFTPALLASAEARIQRSGLLLRGSTRDSFALAIALPPQALSGSLHLDHMTRTDDGLGRRAVSFRYPLARMGAEGPRVEAAYRISGDERWSLGVAGGVGVAGEESESEVLAHLRLAL
jgi:hypothetical protein